MFIYFPLKHFNAPMDLKQLVSVVYPSFFRRVIFALMEILFVEDLDDGYGTTRREFKHIISISKSNLTEEDINKRVFKTLED
jgi:hypothetical protein